MTTLTLKATDLHAGVLDLLNEDVDWSLFWHAQAEPVTSANMTQDWTSDDRDIPESVCSYPCKVKEYYLQVRPVRFQVQKDFWAGTSKIQFQQHVSSFMPQELIYCTLTREVVEYAVSVRKNGVFPGLFFSGQVHDGRILS